MARDAHLRLVMPADTDRLDVVEAVAGDEILSKASRKYGRHTFAREKALEGVLARYRTAYEAVADKIFREVVRYVGKEIVGAPLKKADDASTRDIERKLGLLTPQQLETIKGIIRDYHLAFAAGAIGPDAIPAADLERLRAPGLVPEDLSLIFKPGHGDPALATMRVTDLAYRYGEILGDAAQKDALRSMSATRFEAHLERTRGELTEVERHAMSWARYSAGQYISGAGDRISLETGTLIASASAEERRRYLGVVQEALEDTIDRRASWRELASDIGHATDDWSRDMQRVAATEMQFAMQEAQARSIAKRADDPEDVRVAKLPAPDACFIAGTMVETSEGPKLIEVLRVGDFVLTHRLRWRRVTAVHVRQYDGVLVGIDGVPPYATGNHPFLVDGSWKRADAIERGEHVVDLRCGADADRDPAIGSQDSLFPRVSPASRTLTAMPASAVEFYRHLQRRDGDVDVEHPDGQFEDYGVAFGDDQKSQGSGVFRGATCTSLPRRGLFALSFWDSRFLTSIAGEFSELPPLFWSAARRFFGANLRSGLDLDPCSAQAGSDGVFRHTIPPCDPREGSSKSGIAGDHVFDRQIDLGVGHVVGFAMPRRVESTTSVSFKGVVYNLTIEDDESYFANGVAVHNCPDCIRLHLTAGPGSPPRIFKLSELQANGTNVGRKRRAWRPTVGPVHPWCFPPGVLVTAEGSYEPIERVEVGDLVVTHGNRLRAVQRLSQRDFAGELVVLTVGDDALKLTPEHPLLTSRGWVCAKDVEVGDDLLQIHEALPSHAKAKNGPSKRREERFLARVLSAFARTGVPVGIDFDDRAKRGEAEVCVVGAERKLWDAVMASLDYRVRGAVLERSERALLLACLRRLDLLPYRAWFSAHSGVSCLREALSLFRVASARHDEVLLGDGPDCDSSTAEAQRDCATRCFVEISQLLDAVSVEIARDDFFDGKHESVDHDVAYHAAAVTSADRAFYEGPVFNFAVEEDESYVANGFVSHNCGCELQEVPDGWGYDEDGDLVPEVLLQKADTRLEDTGDLVKAEVREHMTHGEAVPSDGLVVRVSDPVKRQVIERVLAEAPPAIFRKDVGVTLITTDHPRAQNPLDEHDFAYWTGNEIRLSQTLEVERIPRVLRHELGHSLNVWLMHQLEGGVAAVRAWHDQLWALSEEEGFVSDYAQKLPIENAAEVTRMYLFERPRLMLNHPQQFAFCHRHYKAIFRRGSE